MNTIVISVPEADAVAFQNAQPRQRERLELLLRLRLHDLIAQPVRPLSEIMDEVSMTAAAAGLTSEELARLLQDAE